MGDLLQPWHIIIILGLALLFFGGKKLPELGKGLGEGLKGFKEGMRGINDEVSDVKKTATTNPAATPKPEETTKQA